MLFWLSETGKIWGFQAFWSCSVDFPHYGDPLADIGHMWGFWRTCGSKCRGEGGGIFPTLCVECCLVWYLKLFSDIRNSDFLIAENRISDSRKSFSDIRKSALKSYLAFHTHRRRNLVTAHSAHWPCHSHLYSLLPRPVALESLQPEPRKLYQSSLQCQLMTGIWLCPLFPSPWWQIVRIHPAWRCHLLAWIYIMDLWTRQHSSETTPYSNKGRMFTGSNHHSTCHWTSRYGVLDLSLCSSPQLPLVHWVSSPRMLSPWLWPCGEWWVSCYSNVWLFPAGPGRPKTPLQQNAGTPVGMPRCLGVMATLRFPAPIPAQTTASGMPLVAVPTALPPAMTNQDATCVLPQHSGNKQPSSQDVQNSDSPDAASRLTAFTLDPLTVHRLPTDINDTTDMDQHGDEELVPEGEYDVFRQAVWSSLGRFHSSGDSADDFQEEIRSFISADEVLKDQITWNLQTSLKASLAYCAKIAQGVVTTDQIVDTPLCAPPSAQKNKFKFFTPSNVLGKEHYRLEVDKSSSTSPCRIAPFHGQSLVGLEPQKFDKKIFTLRDQHALHRGLTSHFKVPKKPTPKSSTQFRRSVHQRLGPAVGQEGTNLSFWRGQQNKSRSSSFFTPQEPQEVSRGTQAEGQRLFHPRRRLDHIRVPDNEDTLVGARLVLPSIGKTCWASADRQESCGRVSCWSGNVISLLWQGRPFSSLQGTRNKIYRRPWTACWRRGGHRASPQEPLPRLLQQTVSCSKEDRRSTSCDRPVHIEQTSHHSPFPDGDGPDLLLPTFSIIIYSYIHVTWHIRTHIISFLMFIQHNASTNWYHHQY